MHTVFLDLDQTCIAGVTPEELMTMEGVDESLPRHELLNEDGDVDYYIFERPGLQKFLTKLFSDRNVESVNVWTAASAPYATFIAKNILRCEEEGRRLGVLLHADHCSVSSETKVECSLGCHRGQKHLCMLTHHWKLPGCKSPIIFDDNKKVYQKSFNKGRAIQVDEFYPNKDDSEHLERAYEKFQKYITDKILNEDTQE